MPGELNLKLIRIIRRLGWEAGGWSRLSVKHFPHQASRPEFGTLQSTLNLHYSTSVTPEVGGGAEVGRSLGLKVRDLASKIKWRSIEKYTQHQYLCAFTMYVLHTSMYTHIHLIHTYTSHTHAHMRKRYQLAAWGGGREGTLATKNRDW